MTSSILRQWDDFSVHCVRYVRTSVVRWVRPVLFYIYLFIFFKFIYLFFLNYLSSSYILYIYILYMPRTTVLMRCCLFVVGLQHAHETKILHVLQLHNCASVEVSRMPRTIRIVTPKKNWPNSFTILRVLVLMTYCLANDDVWYSVTWFGLMWGVSFFCYGLQHTCTSTPYPVRKRRNSAFASTLCSLFEHGVIVVEKRLSN
jgi:hypothetical protein